MRVATRAALFAALLAILASLGFSRTSFAWWCRPSGGCEVLREACEEKSKGQVCAEYQDVFRYTYSMSFPDPTTGLSEVHSEGYPSLAQCEAARKLAGHEPSDRGKKCSGYLSLLANLVSRAGKTATGIPQCQRAVVEEDTARLQQLLALSGVQQNRIFYSYGRSSPKGLTEQEQKSREATLHAQLDAEQEATNLKIDGDGLWAALFILGFMDDQEKEDWERTYITGGKDRLERRIKAVKKQVIVGETLSKEDWASMRWALLHVDDPKAQATYDGIVKRLKDVELTLEFDAMSKPLAWIAGHLSDHRSKCLVELLAKSAARDRAELPRLESIRAHLKRRIEKPSGVRQKR